MRPTSLWPLLHVRLLQLPQLLLHSSVQCGQFRPENMSNADTVVFPKKRLWVRSFFLSLTFFPTSPFFTVSSPFHFPHTFLIFHTPTTVWLLDSALRADKMLLITAVLVHLHEMNNQNCKTEQDFDFVGGQYPHNFHHLCSSPEAPTESMPMCGQFLSTQVGPSVSLLLDGPALVL